MIDAKKELQYRLAIRMLEHLSEKGLLSAPEKNTPRRLFGNSAGYSADSVVACVLPKKMQGGHSVEYQYYLRQIYRKDGSIWIDILEAAQAEKLGYQDGDKYTQNDGVVYINGFDSPSALNTFIEDLHGCVNRSEAMAAHQREER